MIHGYNNKGKAICGAITQEGAYCRKLAGSGTDHLGEGFCMYHDDGFSAVHEDLKGTPDVPLYVQLLPENIQHNWKNLASDTIKDLTNTIRFCNARMTYLLDRIANLQGQTLETVTEEEGYSDKEGTKGHTQRRIEGTENLIQRYESEITKIQTALLKALDLKSKIEQAQVSDGDYGNIQLLVSAVRQSKDFNDRTKIDNRSWMDKE